MASHLATALPDEDFTWLANHKFNAVRLPVGYWNAIGGAATRPRYVPSDAAGG